jgi:hypothetical protein
MEDVRIKAALRISINEIMEQFLPHIFMSEYGDFSSLSRQTAKAISIQTQRQLAKMTRVEIEGYEVEPMDIDEIMTETLYWKEINQRIEHSFFKEDTINQVVFGKGMMRLNTNYIYRYVAFYEEDGSIRRDYDELDIKSVLGERIRLGIMKTKLVARTGSILGRMQKDIGELEKTLLELEKVSTKLHSNK